MRYAARIEYDGTAFHGWQRQKREVSVQAEVEKALSRVADTEVPVVCAGRTDTGVHSVGQVVHFDCPVERSIKAWVMGANTFLPRGVAVKMVMPVVAEFHARYSAVSRTYRYVIANARTRSPLRDKSAAWIPQRLEIESMQSAADFLLGEHDFSAFRAAGCQAKGPVRTVHSLRVGSKRGFIYIDITANAFLHNMVRIVVGTLIKIGKGEERPEWADRLLKSRDRTLGGMTAPAHGLYFIGPRYPTVFSIPEVENWPEF